jgi:hypothetical protein
MKSKHSGKEFNFRVCCVGKLEGTVFGGLAPREIIVRRSAHFLFAPFVCLL